VKAAGAGPWTLAPVPDCTDLTSTLETPGKILQPIMSGFHAQRFHGADLSKRTAEAPGHSVHSGVGEPLLYTSFFSFLCFFLHDGD
jgi:hypothetical protein